MLGCNGRLTLEESFALEINNSRVVSLPQVGSSSRGQDVHFALRLQNGTTQSFVCSYEKLGQIVSGLMRAADLAAREQQKHGDPPQDLNLDHIHELQDAGFRISDDRSSVIFDLKTQQRWKFCFRSPLEVLGRLSDHIYAQVERPTDEPSSG